MCIVDLLLQGVCVSASYYLGRVILKRPGSTCKLHTGYCDSFGFCITVDSDDLLNNLRDAFKRLFSKAAIKSLWTWIKGHWYVFHCFELAGQIRGTVRKLAVVSRGVATVGKVKQKRFFQLSWWSKLAVVVRLRSRLTKRLPLRQS